jgi:hypothetical protein
MRVDLPIEDVQNENGTVEELSEASVKCRENNERKSKSKSL